MEMALITSSQFTTSFYFGSDDLCLKVVQSQAFYLRLIPQSTADPSPAWQCFENDPLPITPILIMGHVLIFRASLCSIHALLIPISGKQKVN